MGEIRRPPAGPPPLRLRWDRIGVLLAVLTCTVVLTIRAAVGGSPATARTAEPVAVRSTPAPTATARPCDRSLVGRTVRSAPGDGTTARTVALTFDDGPGVWTPKVLAVLKEKKVRASFFVIGRQAVQDPAAVRAVAAGGHLIGNHTWSHPLPPASGWNAKQLAIQLQRTDDVLRPLTGAPTCFFRPPGGVLAGAQGPAAARSQAVALWSVDTSDWREQEHGTASPGAVAAIVAAAEAGATLAHPVILMHDGGGYRGATVAALPAVIDFYRAAGYTFVTL